MTTKSKPLRNANKVPADPMIKREWVKYRLRAAGSSFAELAREIGVSRQAPQSALDRRYPRMETAIAEKIGLLPEQVWPERYAKRKK